MRVTLVISSLRAGGAERVLSLMASYWAERGWPVTLVTLDSESSDYHELHPDVERIALGLLGESHAPWEALRNNARRVTRLRDAIRAARPDVVISFMAPTTVLALMATRLLGLPVVVSERVAPTRQELGPVWEALRRLHYPLASAVVVQTPEVRLWAARFVSPMRVHVLPNPVVAPGSLGLRRDALDGRVGLTRSASSRTARLVMAMGRLHPQKGFDLLIRAFAKCYAGAPDWSLVILGEGPERDRLRELASQLGVASAVSIPGRAENPAAVLRRSDLFVLSSRYEGFPNALLEAMAAGLPVISTDCPYGPSHIVRDGVDGVLVRTEDVDALADAMTRLMGAEERRAALAARAMEVTDRFGIDRVMAGWQHLLEGVVTDAPVRRHPAYVET